MRHYSLVLAPILDKDIISYEVVEYDGRFIEENVFRQAAGPEVDAAWDSLGGGCKLIFRVRCLLANADLYGAQTGQ